MLCITCGILISYLGLSSSFIEANTTAQADDTHVFICFDCSAHDDHATLNQSYLQPAECQSPELEKRSVDTALCSGPTKDYVEFNPTSTEMFLLRSESADAETTNSDVPDTTRTLINQVYALNTHLVTIQRELGSVWRDYDVAPPLTEHIYPAHSVFANGSDMSLFQRYCALQAGHMATYMIFSDTFKSYIEEQINEDYKDRLKSDDVARLLQEFTITQFSLSQIVAEQNGKRIHIHFESQRVQPSFMFSFGQPRNLTPDEHGRSSVQYTVMPSDDARYIRLSNVARESHIAGTGLDAMSPGEAIAAELRMENSCVIEALNAHFPYIKQNLDGSIRAAHGFEEQDLTPDKLVTQQGEDGLILSKDLEGYCRMSYYRGRNRLLAMLIPCNESLM